MNDMAEQVFREALEQQKPSVVIADLFRDGALHLPESAQKFKPADFKEVHLVGSGKASWPMIHALHEQLHGREKRALAISSYTPDDKTGTPEIKLHKAAHPVPDQSSVEAGDKLIRFFKEVPPNSLLLYAISGGTSSLVCRPAGDITIEELNHAYDLLNNSGATIRQINTVRKHLSRVKGGQLLRHLDPSAILVDLVISDVPDDDLQIIGSGPTTPDGSSFEEAYEVLLNFNLWKKLAGPVRTHIKRGIDGAVPGTVKKGEDPIKQHYSVIVGSAAKLAGKAAELLREKGYNCRVADSAYNKDVGDVASEIAEQVLAVRRGEVSLSTPAALLFYGESTVQVTGKGKGGRNQELALRGALEIRGHEGITWLSAGTDGIDGPTDAAGGVVDGHTIADARKKGLDPQDYLQRNDAYHFHEEAGTLLKTGPTGNNLMDLQIVLVD